MHIVEQLISERATKLMSHKRLFRMIRPALYRVLAYDAAVFLADAVRDKSGREAFDMVAEHVKPRTAVSGLQNVPKEGRCIVIANHPTGLADGMAMYQALRDKRPDHLYLANADALRVMPNGEDIIIPVEWVMEKRSLAKTRETLMACRKALNEERCIVIFPSGRLAKMTFKGLIDQPWESSAAMMAKKYKAPVIPCRMEARNSWLYYFFAKVNNELRDITLFHELLNKKNQTFDITFKEAVPPEALPKNADEATAMIRNIVETATLVPVSAP